MVHFSFFLCWYCQRKMTSLVRKIVCRHRKRAIWCRSKQPGALHSMHMWKCANHYYFSLMLLFVVRMHCVFYSENTFATKISRSTVVESPLVYAARHSHSPYQRRNNSIYVASSFLCLCTVWSIWEWYSFTLLKGDFYSKGILHFMPPQHTWNMGRCVMHVHSYSMNSATSPSSNHRPLPKLTMSSLWNPP